MENAADLGKISATELLAKGGKDNCGGNSSCSQLNQPYYAPGLLKNLSFGMAEYKDADIDVIPFTKITNGRF